ncbi:MAG: hypothetical protein GY757_57670, partial [bacterium]|nr:hypothetical protein [bacterium]
FGLQGVKIFYLSNTKAEDTKKLVLTVFRDQKIQIQEDKSLNSLITKGSINTLREIEKFLYSVDKIKSEVELDVEILELNRNLVNSLGLDYGDAESAVSTISFGEKTTSTDSDGETTTSVNSGPFTIPSMGNLSFFVTVPSVALSFLKADTSTKILSKPNLRGLDGEEVKFMVGDEVPILQTQFQSSGAGGYGNIP